MSKDRLIQSISLAANCVTILGLLLVIVQLQQNRTARLGASGMALPAQFGVGVPDPGLVGGDFEWRAPRGARHRTPRPSLSQRVY